MAKSNVTVDNNVTFDFVRLLNHQLIIRLALNRKTKQFIINWNHGKLSVVKYFLLGIDFKL